MFKKEGGLQVIHSLFFFLFLIWLHQVLNCGMEVLSCGMRDLVPRSRIEPGPPALGVQSLNHWTTREVPTLFLELDTVTQVYLL